MRLLDLADDKLRVTLTDVGHDLVKFTIIHPREKAYTDRIRMALIDILRPIEEAAAPKEAAHV